MREIGNINGLVGILCIEGYMVYNKVLDSLVLNWNFYF